MSSDIDDEDYGSYIEDLECDAVSSVPSDVELSYRTVPASEIIDEMDSQISKANEIFHIKRSQVKRLLVHFRWNIELLIERYYENVDNCSELFREAGIHISPTPSPTDLGRQGSSAAEHGTCEVCFKDDIDLIGLTCHHLYCQPCWQTYLHMMIEQQGSSEDIECMSSECSVIVSESFVLDNVADQKVKNKYFQLMTKSFVSTNKSYKWCPAPGCSYCAQVYVTDVKNIVCPCGMEWCFSCHEPYHAPLRDCQLLRKWNKKASADSGNTSWMVTHTKECPKCRAAIEKSGGCNHMICSNKSCQYEFCWQCLGEWAPHGNSWYSCNKFVEDNVFMKRLTKERIEMERYHHYYKRYTNHMRSYEIEKSMYDENIRMKIDFIQDKHDVTWIDSQFLHKAFETLMKCRIMLKFSYVFAFYILPCSEKDIFEENQRDLEHNTEKLSEALEDKILPNSLSEVQACRTKVNDLSCYCLSRRDVLLKDVQKGYDKGIWAFTK